MIKNLDDVFKEVIFYKNKGLKYPVDKKIYINNLDNISAILKNIKQLDYKKNSIIVPKITYICEVLNMINFIIDKNINKKAKNIINKTEVDDNLSDIDSILYTTKILEIIKNENILEFYEYFQNNYVILFYLEEYLARNFKSKNILNNIMKYRLNEIINLNEYYNLLRSESISTPNKYILEMEILNHIYPVINGYIKSLKLMEINDKKLVLNEIKQILNNKQTTSKILNKFEVDKIDTKKVLSKKIELLK